MNEQPAFNHLSKPGPSGLMKVVFFALIIYSTSSPGQTWQRTAIVGTSLNAVNEDQQLSYTIGQTLSANLTGSDLSLQTGFQQVFPLLVNTHEINPMNLIQIYPNPTSDKIAITTKDQADYQWKLINATGQTLRESGTLQALSNTSISLAAYPNGVYYLQISSQVDQQNTNTFIIVKS